jgi:hypothetical protein
LCFLQQYSFHFLNYDTFIMTIIRRFVFFMFSLEFLLEFLWDLLMTFAGHEDNFRGTFCWTFCWSFCWSWVLVQINQSISINPKNHQTLKRNRKKAINPSASPLLLHFPNSALRPLSFLLHCRHPSPTSLSKHNKMAIKRKAGNNKNAAVKERGSMSGDDTRSLHVSWYFLEHLVRHFA